MQETATRTLHPAPLCSQFHKEADIYGSISVVKKRLQIATHRLLLLAGFLLAFALRLYHLGAESLWYDETVSVYLARKSLVAMLAHTAGDIHPPGYYLLLHGWHLVTRPTLAHGFEFLYAWPSLFFGVLILALLYCLGRHLLGKEVALLAVWLAALHPFQIWYSQEVRMYTVGAALGLLCLWALIKVTSPPEEKAQHVSRRWLVLYALTAAVGMYTLYYFLFLLVGLNLLALYLWWHSSSGGRARWNLIPWLTAQLAVPLLFAPWLAIFFRQVTDPPVPPWRVAWDTLAGLLASLSESLCALLFGQSPPGEINWPWALVTLLILATVIVLRFAHTKSSVVSQPPLVPFSHAVDVLLIYTFTPIAIIYIVTYFLTPLYHVRYLFTYSPPLLLLIAAALHRLSQARLGLAVVACGLLVVGNSLSLYEFWYLPAYRTDDHRAAVAELAANWRPGDVILVNAGWPYTAIELYWPSEVIGAQGFAPPANLQRSRLGSVGTKVEAAQPVVPLITTGSIDGNPTLGWNNSASDFYALAADDALLGLQQLIEQHPRIWHYRLYDTVSDPAGILRARLATRTRQWWDKPYPGRDYLRLQLFAGSQAVANPEQPSVDEAQFGSELRLIHHNAPVTISAGTMLYCELRWEVLADLVQLQSDLTMSLRLYDHTGELLTQQDGVAIPPTTQWPRATKPRQPLAVGVPVAAKPGRYRLELVVYRTTTGEPLSVTDRTKQDSLRVIYGQRWYLGDVTIQPAQQVPELPPPLAHFDYIDLISVTPDRQSATAGETINFELIWRPRPSPYRDRYTVVLALQSTSNNRERSEVAQWRATLGGDEYPSSDWQDLLPVRERRQVVLPNTLPIGNYQFTLQMERSSDGLPLTTQQGFGWQKQKFIVISELATR